MFYFFNQQSVHTIVNLQHTENFFHYGLYFILVQFLKSYESNILYVNTIYIIS